MSKFNSPIEAFLYWEKESPDNPYLRQPLEGGMKTWTYKEAGEEVRRMATALNGLNMPPQSKVALISKNCAHWIMADLAIMMTSNVSVPLYPTLAADTIKLVLEHSESKAVIIGKLDNYEVQKSGIPDIHKIGVSAYGINETHGWEEMIDKNEPLQDVPIPEMDDLLTIIYTSGTTGMPKGVMHTVGNLTKTVNNADDVIPMPANPQFFSFLPLSHVAERVAVHYHGMYRGAVFNFPHSLETFGADLAAAEPHMFFAVPRIWAKFQEKILEKMPQKKLDMLLGIPIIGGIVKKKIVKKLGLSRAYYMTTGAAPIAVSMLDWYEKLGIIIHQAYGMTEDCILSHYNLVGANKKGTVGPPLPGVTAKLTAEGEICIKSEVLMTGYYKEPELTAEMFDEDGFLKTGDIGEYDHDGYLTITGRVKDQFKTDKGKYIAPAPIELELLKNGNIEQACLVGMGIPQPIALVIPSLASKNITKDELSASLLQTIQELNPTLSKHEQVEKVVVMKEDWTVDNGLMTPTLKVKRNQVEKIHMPMYTSWFDNDDKVIYE